MFLYLVADSTHSNIVLNFECALNNLLRYFSLLYGLPRVTTQIIHCSVATISVPVCLSFCCSLLISNALVKLFTNYFRKFSNICDIPESMWSRYLTTSKSGIMRMYLGNWAYRSDLWWQHCKSWLWLTLSGLSCLQNTTPHCSNSTNMLLLLLGPLSLSTVWWYS